MVDPITSTLAGIVGGTLFGKAASGGGSSAPQPSAPAAPPPPAQDPVGTRSGKTTTAPPSFVGSTAIPQQSGYGQKSLLGQ